ncbi:MAG: hypothetical protein FWD84_06115 [Oscillospiraceae bacterium]|nr:hypothetical protein [Oscillospiraceae bacterium]
MMMRSLKTFCMLLSALLLLNFAAVAVQSFTMVQALSTDSNYAPTYAIIPAPQTELRLEFKLYPQ